MSGLAKALSINAALGLLLAPCWTGCVTEAQANARAKEAYLAGQKAALASIAGEGKMVVIVGPVEHPNVPWVEGLTLAQAVATANYIGHRNPRHIAISREGVDIAIDPRDLLNGRVVLLQPGDTVKIRE
ncbi:MAG TPA: hypothetical protein VMB80_16135 [Candidatus Acidoferrum sp.]|nr:hypothetical protein [Candidatus Acidoferrum sp.]